MKRRADYALQRIGRERRGCHCCVLAGRAVALGEPGFARLLGLRR
jgi:hypothetical protein